MTHGLKPDSGLFDNAQATFLSAMTETQTLVSRTSLGLRLFDEFVEFFS
jgi:hypothetical protein